PRSCTRTFRPTTTPRTRGDQPARSSGVATSSSNPPHTRGSTLDRDAVWTGDQQPLAHAGINPPASESPKRLPPTPRTRGDQPSPSPVLPATTFTPPPPRTPRTPHPPTAPPIARRETPQTTEARR